MSYDIRLCDPITKKTFFYCCKDGLNWVFETDISHETFLTFDGGYDDEFADFDDGFARCIVFEVSALKSVDDIIGLPDN